MNLIIKVSFASGEQNEKKEILMNTNNIETIYPIGYTKRHKQSLIMMVSGNTYFITEEVYKKLIAKLKPEKL